MSRFEEEEKSEMVLETIAAEDEIEPLQSPKRPRNTSDPLGPHPDSYLPPQGPLLSSIDVEYLKSHNKSFSTSDIKPFQEIECMNTNIGDLVYTISEDLNIQDLKTAYLGKVIYKNKTHVRVHHTDYSFINNLVPGTDYCEMIPNAEIVYVVKTDNPQSPQRRLQVASHNGIIVDFIKKTSVISRIINDGKTDPNSRIEMLKDGIENMITQQLSVLPQTIKDVLTKLIEEKFNDCNSLGSMQKNIEIITAYFQQEQDTSPIVSQVSTEANQPTHSPPPQDIIANLTNLTKSLQAMHKDLRTEIKLVRDKISLQTITEQMSHITEVSAVPNNSQASDDEVTEIYPAQQPAQQSANSDTTVTLGDTIADGSCAIHLISAIPDLLQNPFHKNLKFNQNKVVEAKAKIIENSFKY